MANQQPMDQDRRILQRRPAEVFSAGIGSATGAVFVIVGAFVPIPDQVPSATMILVSWIAALVTTWVEYRRRSTGPST